MEYSAICTNCGNPFKTHNTLTKYCSPKCKAAYHRAKSPVDATMKDMADLSKEIEAMPDFIEDINGTELVEPAGIEIDIPILAFVKSEPVPVAASPAPKPTPRPKPKPIRHELSLDLTGFITFSDGLRLFTSIIRNDAINPGTKDNFLSKLQEAAMLHTNLSPNQVDAIYARITNYRSGSYVDKQTDIHRL